MTSSQRAHLIAVWCNFKCRRCCHLQVDTTSSPEDALLTISGGVLSSSSAPPPPYDVALSMPRVTAGSTVKFQIGGQLFEFKMESPSSSLSTCSAATEPPRFVDNDTSIAAATSTRHSIGGQRTTGTRPAASLPVLPSALSRPSRATISATTVVPGARHNGVTSIPTGRRGDEMRSLTSVIIRVAAAYQDHPAERDSTRF